MLGGGWRQLAGRSESQQGAFQALGASGPLRMLNYCSRLSKRQFGKSANSRKPRANMGAEVSPLTKRSDPAVKSDTRGAGIRPLPVFKIKHSRYFTGTEAGTIYLLR